ncbi:L-seryl-tRNA(Sec) selenium transferase [Dermatophilus congolensis]|uniref:L-seryl-tRNA(Sec) selenium transferase n=1 Tax=Dermatophilus congolensis TaxID=1863 RepID=UPI000E0F39AD|nr:L-seryl-tRNA(Sec) selenium transferase [Dermatophilus congolensis]
MSDPRRRIPSTDAALAAPELADALTTHGRAHVKAAIQRAQRAARAGHIHPEDVITTAANNLTPLCSFTPVLNATGIVIHTNLGRAPLSTAARHALTTAAGTIDLELSLHTGRRSRRGTAAENAVLDSLDPDIRPGLSALLLNNGAAALCLATTACTTPTTPDIIISRGEMVEIGAGFRLTDLITTTGAHLIDIGTTNRTHPHDYSNALTTTTGCVLKIHPSNFRIHGFTSTVDTATLAHLLTPHPHIPLIVDVGSGLLRHDPTLPNEPDLSTTLRDGADLALASGDKLLGGPQAGILIGRTDLINHLRNHPLARAFRIDKLALAALEATLRGPEPPITRARKLTPTDLHERTTKLAHATGSDIITTTGHIGGGGAPEHPLPSLAVALPTPPHHTPDSLARTLRTGTPAILARIADNRVLIDLRCIDPTDDTTLTTAITTALHETDPHTCG